jgi:SAM-dependent methyltransferase
MPGSMFSSVHRTGEEFDDPDVVRCYARRPAYPAELHERLVALAPGLSRVLDLGCGPGKLAIALSPRFEQVTAVDPSRLMLEVARALESTGRRNIRWIQGRAEDAGLAGPFDLIVIGAAIHWMLHDRVMPKLRRVLRDSGILALVDGDAPSEAPWIDAYRAHVKRWVEKGGAAWRDPANVPPPHLNWIKVQGRETFECAVRQQLDDLVEAEHSRATWSRATMGHAAASQFDSDLRGLLEPHALGGEISYTMRTSLVWGWPLDVPA